MLISVPIAYRATVVRAGKRKEESCMLAFEMPLRIPDAMPRLAARTSPDYAAMAARARNAGELADMVSWAQPLTWFTDGRGILSDLRLPGIRPGGPSVPAEEFAAFIRNTIGLPSASGMFCSDNHPFQANAPLDVPVYREGAPFSVLSAAPGARGAAIAFAVGSAARCAARPDGTVAVPCTVPMLDVSYNVVKMRSGEGPRFVNPAAAFGLDEWDCALAMASASPAAPDLPSLRVDVRWFPGDRDGRAGRAVDFLCRMICRGNFKGPGAACMRALADELGPLIDDAPGSAGAAPDRRAEAADILGARAGDLLALGWPALASSSLCEFPGMMLATAARWNAAVPGAAPGAPRGP